MFWLLFLVLGVSAVVLLSQQQSRQVAADLCLVALMVVLVPFVVAWRGSSRMARKAAEIAGSIWRPAMFVGMMATLGYAVCTPSGLFALKIMVAIMIGVVSLVGIVVAIAGMLFAYRCDEHLEARGDGRPVEGLGNFVSF